MNFFITSGPVSTSRLRIQMGMEKMDGKRNKTKKANVKDVSSFPALGHNDILNDITNANITLVREH